MGRAREEKEVSTAQPSRGRPGLRIPPTLPTPTKLDVKTERMGSLNNGMEMIGRGRPPHAPTATQART